MTEAVEGDLVERLRAIAEWLPNSTSAHVSRGHCKELLVEDAAAIRRAIAALSDLRERFRLVDAKLIETYAAISRAEAERVDPTDPALLAAVAEAIGKADGIDTKRIQRREYAKHARAALDVIAARLSRTVQDSP